MENTAQVSLDPVMRRSNIDAGLSELYAQIPQPGCKDLCANSCGPIGIHPASTDAPATFGVTIPHHENALDPLERDGAHTCPALKDGRCGV